ncbi:hypothetical protein T4D_14138 [Trichinella pseudospiralis]|uniref:Uncharacterized protein n=1 Tax=Trichinella pseudospiralis TaxID=6337 RepID=A0A0V1FGN2_TRIPS|nr:hypothetical protein T4D_14138 [Trichinella pseudospiralis]
MYDFMGVLILQCWDKHASKGTCFKQAITRINLRYREESGGQSQLTDFRVYRLAEVEVAALYSHIPEVDLILIFDSSVSCNESFQQASKYCSWNVL